MPQRVTKARIACLDMNLQKARMMMGVQVLVNDPNELEKVCSWPTLDCHIVLTAFHWFLGALANIC